MEKELNHLGDQCLCYDYLKEINHIMKDEYNQDQLKKGGILSVSLDCFALGIIIGKKIERAKRKNKK
jgi:hypothetical protein